MLRKFSLKPIHTVLKQMMILVLLISAVTGMLIPKSDLCNSEAGMTCSLPGNLY